MRRRIPPLQALNCFEAAARHESYTRAAQELSLTQGAVSRQIASLEAFLGTTLFDRTRHGVRLTVAGSTYAKRIATRLVHLERDTLDVMAYPTGERSLHLATVPTFSTRWLMPRLPEFFARFPDITLHFDTSTRPFLFAETSYDAALFAGTPEQVANWPGTSATLLLREEAVPVASPCLLGGRRPWRPNNFERAPLLQQSTRPHAWRQWFAEAGVEAAEPLRGPRYELFSMLAMAATQGLGIALIPAMLVESELARGELRVASPRPLGGERGYYLVVPETGIDHPALGCFREWLLHQARKIGAPLK